MARNACARKIFEFLPRHFDHRNDADVGVARGDLIGACRGQREAKIENLSARSRCMEHAPHQRDRIQITHRAHARHRNCGILQALLVPQISDVAVRAGARVVGEIQTIVIRIFVNHDLIAVPQPVPAEAEIRRPDRPVEVIEPEAIWTAASQSEHVTLSDSACKAAMFERMVDVKTRIVLARIVADPFIIGVDVRSFRMVRLVGEGLGLFDRLGVGFGDFRRSRAVRGNMSAADVFGVLTVTAVAALAWGLSASLRHRSQ